MDAVWIGALWVSFGLVGYAYVGYPFLLAVLGRLRGERRLPASDELPTVTVLVPAHNEAAFIERKIRNVLDLDYPAERLQILVVSDASTDGTDEIVSRFTDRGVTALRLPERRGKGAALNLGLSSARNEIVVFTDASILLEREALSALARRFASPDVGCVSGEDHIPGGGGEGAYGRYELLLRNLESRVASIVGASGCFYGQRRELCVPFLEGMAPDFLSVLETVKRGRRAVTEPAARGTMRSVPSAGREFQRKVRTMLRGITTLARYRALLNPFRFGLFAVELWSHKVLRWASGALLVVALVANVVLAADPFYRLPLAAQGAFYLAAALGWVGGEKARRISLFRIPFFFCMVSGAALVAWTRYVLGQRQEIWEPSRRSHDDDGAGGDGEATGPTER